MSQDYYILKMLNMEEENIHFYKEPLLFTAKL